MLLVLAFTPRDVARTLVKEAALTGKITFRQIVPDDGQQLTVLYQASPDTGLIQIAPRYHLDAYTAFAAMQPGAIGVVAELPDLAGLAGAGFVRIGQCYFEGELRQYASLSGLVVHPDFRRRGIASSLADWRIEWARERIADTGLLLAGIQKQNSGSFSVAQRWVRQFGGPIVIGAAPMRDKSPQQPEGISVRLVQQTELPTVVDGLNRFYDGYNLYEPHETKSLGEWLAQSPFETPFRYYWVAVNQAGDVLAGLAVTEQYRAIEMQVKKLPTAVRLLNKVVKLVPPDGTLKQLAISKVWFAPGQLRAAQYLWETIRWKWYGKAGTLTVFFDPRSPLSSVFRIPFWIPKSRLALAVNGPILMQKTTLIYPV